MAIRPGDPTVELEARIEHTTAKAYLIEPTMGKQTQVWLPKSQIAGMTERDPENGTTIFQVSRWWYDRAEIDYK
jgi:hypothetical protein